jgi:hypothetical protein
LNQEHGTAHLFDPHHSDWRNQRPNYTPTRGNSISTYIGLSVATKAFIPQGFNLVSIIDVAKLVEGVYKDTNEPIMINTTSWKLDIH